MRLHGADRHKQATPASFENQTQTHNHSLYFFLSFVAAFPFATPLTVLARFLRCLPIITIPISPCLSPYAIPPKAKGYTYAVACSPSQSWSQPHISPTDNAARTSSSPHANRRSTQSPCSYHHRIEFGNRSMILSLCLLCRAQRALSGALL